MTTSPLPPEDYGSITSNNGSTNINTVTNTRSSIKLHSTLDSIDERQHSSPRIRMLSSSPKQIRASPPPPSFQRHSTLNTPLLNKKDDALNGEPTLISRGDESEAQSGESE
jgi:hypothetical protein